MSKSKIPEVTLLFWIMKICATTLGETAGDLMSMTLDVGYAISSLILVITLVSVPGLWYYSERSHSLAISDHLKQKYFTGQPF